jgi:hypothetical protein
LLVENTNKGRDFLLVKSTNKGIIFSFIIHA